MVTILTQFERCQRANLVDEINKETIPDADKSTIANIIYLDPESKFYICKHKQGQKCKNYILSASNVKLCSQNRYR